MKNNPSESEIDFIGGGRSLTKEDKIAISNYIRAYKEKHSKRQAASKRAKRAITKTFTRRKKVIAATK